MSKFVKLTSPSGVEITFYALSIGIIQDHPEEMKALFGVRKEGESPFEPSRFKKLETLYVLSACRGGKEVTEAVVREVVDLETIKSVNDVLLGMLPGPEEVLVKAEKGSDSSNPTMPQTGGGSTPA